MNRIVGPFDKSWLRYYLYGVALVFLIVAAYKYWKRDRGEGTI